MTVVEMSGFLLKN